MFGRIVLVLTLSLVFSHAFAKERITFIYYYGWYGNPAYDLQWLHWQENQHQPPWDIASSFYPKLGPYSSRDPGVLDLHMKWIAQAHVHALIFSWWGSKDPTNEIAEMVLDAAAKYNLKVAFLIEPYPGRTTKKICDDIEYLTDSFGEHPAFLKIARQTTFGQNSAERGVFFIYDPDFSDSQLRRLSDTIHTSHYDSILLLQSTDAGLIERTHSDGIFAYEAVIDVMYFYKGIQKAVEEEGGLFVPCVSPGFSIKRLLGEHSPLLQKRKHGDAYDDWWEQTIVADPEFVAVLSFNEWHEGTQIEPAIQVTKVKPPYLSYEKSYGKSGVKAQFSYLRRTARWIKLFLQLP